MNITNKFRSAPRRARLFLIAILLPVIWMLWPDDDKRKGLHPPRATTEVSRPCFELRPEFGPYQEADVKEPGLHCAASDFWQQRLYGGGHSGPAPYRQLIEIHGDHVTIDLQSHILHSDGHSSGIVATVQSNLGSAEYAHRIFGERTTNITIRNGVIDLRGLGTGVAFINQWGMRKINESVPEKLKGYEKSHFILENLLIKTDNVGVILEGDGNIIRNCIIESGGNAAIMMAGPNGQILNNTIVLTDPFIPGSMRGVSFGEFRNFVELMEQRRTPKAAIALHQANGTVISGNRIEVKGKSPIRHNIYVTNRSKDVRIEGNTIVGSDDPVTLVEGSTAKLKNNVFEKSKAPWWKF